MSSVEVEIADIERELLALTADQPPNPAQITTFSVTRTSVGANEVKTIVFDASAPRWIDVYTTADLVYLYADSGQLKVEAVNAGTTYTLVSLGSFSVV